MSTQVLTQPNTEAMRIPDAIKAAIMRKISRLAGMREELEAAGWTHIVTTSELYLLEAEGFIVDFDSGLCVDTFADKATMSDANAAAAGPGSCPYCHSSNVTAHAGFWECHDCGQSGSY